MRNQVKTLRDVLVYFCDGDSVHKLRKATGLNHGRVKNLITALIKSGNMINLKGTNNYKTTLKGMQFATKINEFLEKEPYKRRGRLN